MSVRRTASKKLEAGTSLGSSFTTDPTDIKFLDNVGYLVICTGVTSNTGIFTPQVQVEDGTWVDLTLDVPAQIADSDINMEISLNQLPYEKVRLSFADSSGDGVCDIFVSAKALGG
jgi:hypothetical protein